MKEYAVYKGDELLAVGTVKEIAKELNVQVSSVYFWSSKVNKRRNQTRTANRKVAYLINFEDEEGDAT